MIEDKTLIKLRENLAEIQSRIAEAAFRSGRKAEEITFVAVTKTVDAKMIELLANLGIQHLGENRVQDAMIKSQVLSKLSLNWHLIGHLQKNKVKNCLKIFHWIHSVDSSELAREISQKATSKIPILLEVNISGEISKQGFSAVALEQELEQILQFPNICVQGLMTMAPLNATKDICRKCFSGLRELGQKFNRQYHGSLQLQHLSMGMSQDYEVAIEEGATMVRIGSAIFHGLESAQ